jgi:hypothetical protein
MMTDEQIKMGIAGAFNWQIADAGNTQNALFLFVKGVIAERDKEIAALQAQCESYAAELIGERSENAKLRAENRHLQYGDVTITNATV